MKAPLPTATPIDPQPSTRTRSPTCRGARLLKAAAWGTAGGIGFAVVTDDDHNGHSSPGHHGPAY